MDSGGSTTSPSEEEIKKNLFKSAMGGDWEDVVNLYKNHPEVHKSKITRSGDTALHIAISDGKEHIVEQLVKLMSSKEALNVKNERGNTPLHFAASLGQARMCERIATKDSKLIGVRNNDSETPFFLAALHGNKDAFLLLHSICGSIEQGYLNCRRNDGETVLHVAIYGDHFDLAFQIIHRYKKLVNYVNEQGFSPLHLLASKPSAFRSGSHLVRLYRIIYHCIFVDELTVDTAYDQPNDSSKPSEDAKSPTHPKNNTTYPENYNTCINFFQLVSKIYRVLMVSGRKGWHCFNFQKKTKETDEEAYAKTQDNSNQQGSSNQTDHGHQLFPVNYDTCFDTIKFISKATMIILGMGSREIRKIQEKKEKHTWSVQIMNELLQRACTYEYDDNGQKPLNLSSSKHGETTPYAFVDGGNIGFSTGSIDSPEQMTPQMQTDNEANQSQGGESNDQKNGDATGGQKKNGGGKRETALLVAAKNGITEMVEKILELFPVAIHDINTEKKNIVLLAVENRQPHVYQLLLGRKIMRESVFRKVDNDGNSALHLAAKLGDHRPWRIPGAALQMQWEIKWYEFVKESMPLHFFARHNKKSETPRDVFTKSHGKLLKEGGEWLTSTSESCSLVAALIATVAFATSTTVPGGVMEGKGTPTLERETPFSIFAISSLIALCFSVTSMIMFLAILTSRYQERDFGIGLPRKLLVGLTSLFIAITAMLISFCAGHFFVLRDKLKYAAFPVYLVTCLPVTFFAAAQFPLYIDLIWATFRTVPQRSYKAVPL
ncbi:uncharacterized protein LOC132268979 [Cornus florida]|uniref:uncharacterized protein LOC132268979 n=1 Tax=Cornus florida TaxID=4283 RepID=UPI0028988B6E|nr:uncharacterized protein LOC132268979 [Cornus florida]